MSHSETHEHAPAAAPQELDVAIVGYGPVGQALAGLLGQAGHRVGVFERHDQIYPLPRAVHLDHEVMRILQALGVAPQMRSRMLPISEYHWFGADGESIFTMRSPTPARSGWEADYMFFQPELEAALDLAARAHASVSVERGWVAQGLEQDADGVVLALLPAAGGAERVVRSRFLIGADGANSTIREAAGIGNRDLGFRERWLVVDVLPHDIDALSRLPDACQWCDPARPHMHARNGVRHRRWEFMVLPDEQPRDWDSEEQVWELLAPFITPQEGEITRHAVYEFRSLLARRMRAGRVLLAGDAAHLTPPFLGQGMCAGLRDAINIAWKLDLVLAGRADEDLLESVTGERQTQNEAIIALAVELGRISCEVDPAAAAQRDAAMRSAGEAPAPEPLPLSAGVISASDGLAGQLAVQGRVALGGREGLLDDVLGRGFALITASGSPGEGLSAPQTGLLHELGFVCASLTDMKDLDGRLSEWMQANEAHAVIIRPDFYVFGACREPDGLAALVDELESSIPRGSERVLDVR